MYAFYYKLMSLGEKPLTWLLKHRMRRGKEDAARLHERMGMADMLRPEGKLIWVHGASVGEAQSALILIERLLRDNKDIHVLVTTGTKSSAGFLAKKLPERAFHQYIPLDQPSWIKKFLCHWKPDAALWMESELWPNMLSILKQRKIPAALINARLSARSFKRWKRAGKSITELLSAFHLIIAQTPRDENYYKELGAQNVIASGNLKFSAKPLPHNEDDLKALRDITMSRPLWLYASSHAGEEEIACRLHQILLTTFPDLLTIIVPRHPERRDDIVKVVEKYNLSPLLRGENHALPDEDTDIYIADTFGELGLFYRLSPVACIGRSFSLDGGGGHNPIESLQLHCAVLHGSHVQYQQDIFDEMNSEGAAIQLRDEGHFSEILETLLHDEDALKELQEKGASFAAAKAGVIDIVVSSLSPILKKAGIEQ